MVKVDQGEKKQSPMTSRLFLNSVKTWHPDTGIHCVIESVSKTRETDKENRVAMALNMGILEDMPKCRARVIGDDGKVVKITDEYGEERDKIEEISNPSEVTLWIKMLKMMSINVTAWVQVSQSSILHLQKQVMLNIIIRKISFSHMMS